MKKLRVGVVGFGYRGRTMFWLASDCFDFVEPVAVCDVRPQNWYEKQRPFGKPMSEMLPNTKFYENYEDMLKNANLDVVIVETGADIHADFCLKALEANINVLTDIPVVANLEEADRLWKAAQKTSAMISVGANANERRFAVLLEDFYKSGRLGKPYYMEAEYIHWALPGTDHYKRLYENGKGSEWRKILCPIRYCTHSLGPLLKVLDEDIRKVSCMGTGQHAEESEYNDGNKRDDMSLAQFQTESGVVLRLMRNGRCRADIGPHNYRVFGTEGYMELIDRLKKPVIRFNSQKDENTSLQEVDGDSTPPQYENNEKVKEHLTGHSGIDYALLEKFFNALLNGEPAPISLKEGLAMTLPGIYAEESSKRGGELLNVYYPWDKEWSTIIR